MRRLRVKKPNPAVFHICIPYNVHEEAHHQGIDDVELQLDALLLQLNTGEYLPEEEDGDTEDEMLGTESETMLAEPRFDETQSVGSTAFLEHGITSRSMSGIENPSGDAPLASIDAPTPSPKKTETVGNEGERPSARSNSAAELPVTATESAGWPPLRSDSVGESLDYSKASIPSYPDSTHDFFKPPTSKAREVIKQLLKDGEDEKVFQLLNRALKSDLDLDNAIYRILDILERRRVDITSDCYIEKGTTASLLHTALLFRKENATKRLIDQFPDLLYVNYTSKRYRDQTCFHIAVANNDCGLISKMLFAIKDRAERKALLNTVASGDYFIHERPEASTCLSAAASMGQLDMIERLIVEGADLELQGVGGNTLLHLIVMMSIKKLNMLTARKLFKAVYENSGWWWGDAKPDIGTSVDNDSLKREAFRYLMRIPNDAGFTPAALAVHLHSPLTGFILSLEPVFKLQQSELGEMGAVTYDVTGVLSFTPPSDGVGRWHYNVGSILHTLAHTDKVIATDKSDGTIKDVAEMEPISSAIEMKWKVYRWLYLTWFIVHALFMTVLTSTALHHHDTKSEGQDGPVFGLFLPLPLIYLAVEVADFSYTMYRYITTFREPRSAIIAFFKQQLITTGNIPYRVILIIFSLSMIVWCGMYHQGNRGHVVPLSMALILGWMFMLFFCRGCRHVCRFSTMVQRMIVRDLLFFLAVYLFIIIGFSAAVHVLLPEGERQGQRQTTSMTFFLMLNVLANMDTSPLGHYTLYGDYARFLLGTYGIVSAVFLLSLLISMMSTVYSAVKSSDVNLWRYQQLSVMLLLERRFFWWTKLCRLSQNATILRYHQDITDPDRRDGRVYMNIQEHVKH